ncbi:hypothetical protein PVAND_014981 [Polypedilum vanderplanki]|uniref:Uncharacterized protein n=1 Tax=Polypedilum vanderplanki TaxID=319348 RepID=A0A9J6BBA6_POLVA|nr:hypothetical protein PVAND_014981 [Polypedilum vanderplanki]
MRVSIIFIVLCTFASTINGLRRPTTTSTTASTLSPTTTSTTASTLSPTTTSTTATTLSPTTTSTTASTLSPTTTSTTASTLSPTTTSTTTIPTTTKPPPPKACAYFMPYLRDNGPSVNGYDAGTSYKNTTIYIGRGWYNNQFIPGRVDLSNPNNSGVFVTWAGEKYLTSDIEYLVVPNGCQCYFTDPAVAVTRAGVIQNPDINYRFYVGRVQLGNGQIAISKVNYANFQQWWSTSGPESTNTATEILVCETNDQTQQQPTVKYSSMQCAGWAKYLNDDAPTYNGFSAGISGKNHTAWVARGLIGYQLEPGRIEVETPTGAYVSYGSEQFLTNNVESLVIPVGCNCFWISPYAGINSRPGLVRSADPVYHWLVGRVQLGNGQITISKVRSTDFYQWWSNPVGPESSGFTTTEVLVCENSAFTTTQTPAPPKQCALWSTYLNDESPLINGFNAGVSHQNTTVFIGRAYLSNQFQPGRVDVTAGGVFMSYTSEKLSTKDNEYLVVPKGCSCYFTDPTTAATRDGVVQIPDGNFQFYVGRVTFPAGYIAISKVIASNFVQYYSTNGAEISNIATEVLVCETNDQSNTPPLVTYSNSACAMWKTYKQNNAPVSNGLAVGLSRVNTQVYVGRAWINGQLEPGRVDISPANVGVWGSYLGEVHATANMDYLVLPVGCSCKWVSPSIAVLNNPGVVRSADSTYHWVVGLVNISSTQIAISKVRSSDFFQWYTSVSNTELTGTATKILVCNNEEYIAPQSCGFWMNYNNDISPTINGLELGTSWNNKTIYLGRGWYQQQHIPGRIDVTNGNQGVYVSINTGEVKLTADTEYFVVPQGCNCQWIIPSQAQYRDGLVLNPDPVYRFTPGLVNLTNGQIAISKVRSTDFVQWYSTSSSEINNIATKVLVCDTTNPTNVKPVINYATKACAGWKSYEGDDKVSFNGLIAGLSRTNSVAYVGRGYYGAQYMPGRIDITPGSAGAYVSYAGEVFVSPLDDYLILSSNCVCSWVPANVAALSRPGLMRTTDNTYHFLVGLVNISSTQIAISKVRSSDFYQWYTILNNQEVSNYASVVLVSGWNSYEGDDKVSFNGLIAGLSRTNSVAYVGRGYYGAQFMPGRIDITPGSAGTYVSYAGEVFVSPLDDYLILSSNCVCSWVPANVAALSRPGLMRTTDNTYHFLVGLVNISSTQIAISKVRSSDFYQWYTILNNQEISNYASVVLVCETP